MYQCNVGRPCHCSSLACFPVRTVRFVHSGPSGKCVRQICQKSGADIKSWTHRDKTRSHCKQRPCRNFLIQASVQCPVWLAACMTFVSTVLPWLVQPRVESMLTRALQQWLMLAAPIQCRTKATRDVTKALMEPTFKACASIHLLAVACTHMSLTPASSEHCFLEDQF